MKKCFGEAFNLHYLCFLNYLVAEKQLSIIWVIFASISLNFWKINKNVIYQLRSVRIGKNRALCLEC